VRLVVGCFITFEGVEGCGKTTQIRLLAERLIAARHHVVLTREPGGCPIADKIRAILLDAENRAMSPMAELLLYSAARAQHVSEVVEPAIHSGKIVLCDRFTDATVAYQSAGRGLDLAVIMNLNQLACQSVKPDLTILIDCDAETGIRRAKSRIEASTGPREERFELEAIEFHKRVREAYLALACQEPERFLLIDGSGSIESISECIYNRVKSHLQVQ
jgi:dTMP kinase